jgi:bacterioferritin-associated ferredoxin
MFKKSQQFQVIIGQLCFVVTSTQIRNNGISKDDVINTAIRKALSALKHIRSGSGLADQCACGLAGTWEGVSVQLDMC